MACTRSSALGSSAAGFGCCQGRGSRRRRTCAGAGTAAAAPPVGLFLSMDTSARILDQFRCRRIGGSQRAHRDTSRRTPGRKRRMPSIGLALEQKQNYTLRLPSPIYSTPTGARQNREPAGRRKMKKLFGLLAVQRPADGGSRIDDCADRILAWSSACFTRRGHRSLGPPPSFGGGKK